MRPIADIVTLAITVAAAAVIGFGVPAGWLWIGSQLQGSSGATSLSFSVAVGILAGIIVTYALILYAAGWIMSRMEPEAGEQRQRGTAREPWMRGMTDSRPLRPGPAMTAVERVFVTTTVIVSAAAMIWFFFFAEGGGLPSP